MSDRPRWYRRVLPTTALAAALLALATLLVPAVREQVVLSASHRQQEWVELAFDRDAAGLPILCDASRATVRVHFVAVSHLAATEDLPYVVAVGDERQAGVLTVEPGATAAARVEVPRPSRRYVVEVRLRGRDQVLRAHCPEERP